MGFSEKIGCFFGFHRWEKFMGLANIGGGKFSQKYVCKNCRKMQERIG